MATKESFRERQLQELEVIKSIYGTDVENMRPNSSNAVAASQWKPTDIRISLTPLHESSKDQAEIYVRTKLRITCPSKYPKIAPKITLEETKGISDQLKEELMEQLQLQSQELRGEVMIYELIQTVKAFLSKYNKPPRGSFYDEMLQEKQKREQELLDQKKQKEIRERQTLIDEVERRKEMFKNEAKRREPRRSMSESHRHASSSESSECSSPYYRAQYTSVNKCVEHRSSETLYFHKAGRQIRRGSCLGHSQKGGCLAYSGIDIDSGQLFYITEWNIKYSQLEHKCGNGGKCYWSTTEPKCNGNHRIDDVISSIEKQVALLSQLHHKNLVQYECVLCSKRKEGLLIFLAQDFVLGTSLLNISVSLGWSVESVRIVAHGILEALIFLHNKGVSYNSILDSSIFMDNAGTTRCSDFSIVPCLLELAGVSGQRTYQGDLPALGALIEGLINTRTHEMTDFIYKCNSERTLSASELLEHPFVRSALSIQEDKGDAYATFAAVTQRRSSVAGATLQNAQNGALALPQQKSENTSTVPVSQPRLRTEFEVLMYLGKGAFGDVLKVRNKLDNRQYAIKRIPLLARNRQLYNKMTREVELLSRLNHENVVRYFNSWIENVNEEDREEMDKLFSDEISVSLNESIKKSKTSQHAVAIKNNYEDSSSNTWNNCMPDVDSSYGDFIEFQYSNGENPIYDDDEDDDELESPTKAVSPRQEMQIMYIQMEFCEKCTLRTAIDDNLYQNTERLWRLFREIVEGLSHIHQQGIIHRDLKPVNIFLDSHDQIKIGDFGLATTSFLALQSQTEQTGQSHPRIVSEDGTGTGKVGTTLYVAPELTGNASKSTYGQKVDMYTLGIILFEMCQPPFATGMERVQTIVALRTSAIVIPESMLKDSKYDNTVKLIRWLLNHDPAQRPTSEELLSSDLVPPAQVEANELQEMIRHALANPQSKAYKYLISRCLQQESDEVLVHTYHLSNSRTLKSSWNASAGADSLLSFNAVVEFVKAKIIAIFRKHGAININTPLLTPLTRRMNTWNKPVKLMTHAGCVVVLPTDLRTQFVRQITMSGVNMVRRYCIDRVYREEKVFNFHPKESYECVFDIISTDTDTTLADAELLSLAFEIVSEIPRLREKNLTIRMNHTNLLRSILLYCNVPKEKYRELFTNLLDFYEGRMSKFQLQSSATIILEKSKSSASVLIELLLANFLMSGSRSNVYDSALKTLLRSKGEAALLAESALQELECIVSLAKNLGVTCLIHVYAGLSIHYERAMAGGIVWQMLADLKPERYAPPSVLAVGERYDSLLNDFQKQFQSCNVNAQIRSIKGAGVSISLDRLVAAVEPECVKECRVLDVGLCISGSRQPRKDVTSIMRLLWSVGIRCAIIESTTNGVDEAQELAKLGALHIILIAEDGALRVRSWERDRFQEKHITRSELVDFIQKLSHNDGSITVTHEYMTQMSYSSGGGYATGGIGSSFSNNRGEYTLSSSSSASNVKNAISISQLPNVQVVFMTHDKLTSNQRRRLENLVTHQMASTLSQFVKGEMFTVLVIDLPSNVLNAIVGAINPRAVGKKETEQEINHVIERFPIHKRSIADIYSEVIDFLSEEKTSVVALYSNTDSYYRVIV